MMSRSGSKLAGSLLPTELKDIQLRAANIATLNNRLSARLPDALSQHVRVANVRANVLVLMADTPAWNHQIRFQARNIVRWAQQCGARQVTAVRVKTLPVAPFVPVVRAPARPGGQVAESLEAMGATVDSAELRASLSRLANRLRTMT